MNTYYKIPMGTSSSYLIEQDGRCILVDAGNGGKEKKFLKVLQKIGIDPNRIEAVVITHVHYDHVGSLKAIRDICRCPVAVHEQEARLLRTGKVILPPGTNLTGKSVMGLGKRLLTLVPSFFEFPPVDADITLSADMSLQEFGIPGRIVMTPGHTHGSVTVVLTSGEAFVGDLAINYLPWGLGPIFPPFAEDVTTLLKSWDRLLDLNVRTICPAHGQPFPVATLRQKYDEFTQKYGLAR
jgi:hydroxyacylglutathione hydrolase